MDLSNGMLGVFELRDLIQHPFKFHEYEKVAHDLALRGSPFLFSGFSGVIFSKNFQGYNKELKKQWIDTALTNVETYSPELIVGNAGILLALLRASPNQELSEEKFVLKAILSKLQKSRTGIFWEKSPIEILEPSKNILGFFDNLNVKVKDLTCIVDLGFAHGLGGLIFVLSQYCLLRPKHRSELKPIILGLCNYLLKMKKLSKDGIVPAHAFNHQPTNIFKTKISTQGWCYGNPGLSLALLWGAIALNSVKLKKLSWITFVEWNEVLKKSKNHNLYLCHGIAGFAEISRFFYAETDKAEAYEAWKYWIEKNQKKTVPNKRKDFLKAGGFLYGSMGIIAARQCFDSGLKAHDWSAFMGTARICG